MWLCRTRGLLGFRGQEFCGQAMWEGGGLHKVSKCQSETEALARSLASQSASHEAGCEVS